MERLSEPDVDDGQSAVPVGVRDRARLLGVGADRRAGPGHGGRALSGSGRPAPAVGVRGPRPAVRTDPAGAPDHRGRGGAGRAGAGRLLAAALVGGAGRAVGADRRGGAADGGLLAVLRRVRARRGHQRGRDAPAAVPGPARAVRAGAAGAAGPPAAGPALVAGSAGADVRPGLRGRGVRLGERPLHLRSGPRADPGAVAARPGGGAGGAPAVAGVAEAAGRGPRRRGPSRGC